jgi:hypothetical protein
LPGKANGGIFRRSVPTVGRSTYSGKVYGADTMREPTTLEEMALRQKCSLLLEQLSGDALEEAHKDLEDAVAWEEINRLYNSSPPPVAVKQSCKEGKTFVRPEFHYSED